MMRIMREFINLNQTLTGVRLIEICHAISTTPDWKYFFIFYSFLVLCFADDCMIPLVEMVLFWFGGIDLKFIR